MAKSFYSLEEATSLLNTDEDGVKALVRDGKLREFRDGGKMQYKAEDVDKIVGGSGGSTAGGSSAGGSAAGASDEILLEPADDSGIALAPESSDIFSLEELDSEDTASGASAGGTSGGTSGGSKGGSTMQRANEESAVPSVGVNVFDDEDLDESVDPLAQTAVTDIAGLGLESEVSGSGILDLSRESDDTSLGAELLEEIYTDDDKKKDKAADTAAGDDAALPEMESAEEGSGGLADLDEPEPAMAGAAPSQPMYAATAAATPMDDAPDAAAQGLTGFLFVAMLVMWVGGLAAVSLSSESTPGILQWVSDNLLIFAGGALGAGVIFTAVGFVLGKRG